MPMKTINMPILELTLKPNIIHINENLDKYITQKTLPDIQKYQNLCYLPSFVVKKQHKSTIGKDNNLHYNEKISNHYQQPLSLTILKKRYSNGTHHLQKQKPNKLNITTSTKLFNNQLIRYKLWNAKNNNENKQLIVKTEISAQKIKTNRNSYQCCNLKNKYKRSIKSQRKETLYLNNSWWQRKKTNKILNKNLLRILQKKKLQHRISCVSTQPQQDS